MALRRTLLAVACLAVSGLMSGCFLKPEHHEGDALREGLDVRVGGIDYNVFMTRQLNLNLPDDRGYWKGEPAPPGFALFGIFLQACNRSDEDPQLRETTYDATDHFTVVDTQGNEFEPMEPDEDNVFQYHAQELPAGECIPRTGSLAEQGPTAGAVLLFEFPLETLENRPLELEISAEEDAVSGQPEIGRIELDL